MDEVSSDAGATTRRRRVATKLDFFPDDHRVRADWKAKGAAPERNKATVRVQVTKLTDRQPAGVSLKDCGKGFDVKKVTVVSIEEGSLFSDSNLIEGMELISINNIICASAKFGENLLNEAGKGTITVIAKPLCNSPPRRNPKKRRGRGTPFKDFLKHAPPLTGKKKPTVITERCRTRFDKTPARLSKKRQNDLKNTVHFTLATMGKELLTGERSHEWRNEILMPYVLSFYGKEQGESFKSFVIDTFIVNYRVRV